MTKSVRTFVLAVAALALTASSAFAQATIHGDLVKDWANQKDTIVKIANAMPEDKFAYKSTPAQRSYGEQVLHIAQVNVMLLAALGGKTPAPMINMKATSKADIVKAVADSFDYGTAVVKEFDNKTIQDTVQAPFMGPSTRARIVFFLIAHTQDIYGQMAVYLRLNGVVPPASVRP
jgi:uncharacterized damage-inducible protein DinB